MASSNLSEQSLRCSCESLYKSFGKKHVLRGCNFAINAGEMVGLVGENGSGKSTLVRCLLGFIKSDRGMTWISPSLGYCPQDNFLNGRITVSEHFDFMRSIYERTGVYDPGLFSSLVDKLRLAPHLEMRISDLSGGTYQKVKFVTSVFHLPDLIILDEPCDGFDWAMYRVFWEIMSQVKERGASILMISHLLYDKENFDRIIELKEGVCENA
jgi:ABC-2 type transport system ATP-binding protein